MTRKVWALVMKDVRLHGRDIVVTFAGITVLLGLMSVAKPAAPAVIASAAFNFNAILAGFWGEWLISREKTRHTLAWLRGCPVSDTEIVASKFAGVGLCTAAMWSLTSLLYAGPYFVARPGVWLALLLALLAFGALSIATRLRFGQKLGQTLPYAVVAVVVGVFVLSAHAGITLPIDPEHALRHGAGQAGVSLVFLVIYAGIFALVRGWFQSVDTSALLE